MFMTLFLMTLWGWGWEEEGLPFLSAADLG